METEEAEDAEQPDVPGTERTRPARPVREPGPGLLGTWVQIVTSPRTFFENGYPFPSSAHPLWAATVYQTLGFAAYFARAEPGEALDALVAPWLRVVVGALVGLLFGALVSVPGVYAVGALLHWIVRRCGGKADFRVARDIVAYSCALTLFYVLPGGPWLVFIAAAVLLVIAVRGACRGASAVKAVLLLLAIVNVPLLVLGVALGLSPIRYVRLPFDEDTMALSDEEQGYLFIPRPWKEKPSYGQVWAYELPPEPLPERGRLDPPSVTPYPTPKFRVGRVVGQHGDWVQIRQGRLKINEWQVPTCDVGTLDTHPRLELFVEFLAGQAYLVLIPETRREDNYLFVPKNEGDLTLMGDNRGREFDDIKVSGKQVLDVSVWNVSQPGPRTILGVPRLPQELAAFSSNFDSLRKDLKRCLENAPPQAATMPPPSSTLLEPKYSPD